ncbi:hypothetical protein B0A69_01615 [Chryseobacterium shigense]|uniref:Uncharacterized protein n=1 Tax=Chryseobacterium shigense TaxID=297244 RepID=A0A1N7IA97_9FLAO|nr:hypothetical protein [Chryseobacterium shigense]PQA96794.1 hypothetical protein B0A69_01615 [Chryseobacterium shigense]SIS33985.1 hypothetical protein SAMN05421639_102809 [Chryseobacterium shigense]
MIHFICYLKKKKTDHYIVELLKEIFNCDIKEISNLIDEEKSLIKFENRILDDISEFQVELNIYCIDERRVEELKFNNNISLGIAISKNINEDIAVNDENICDNPYQWILIKQNSLFLVEEEEDDNNGITLNQNNRIEIPYNNSI